MASTHKSLRSGTANKRPTTSIADGQIALNTNAASPGLYFKDSTGASIIKIGPVHVGTTAPNVAPAGSSGNSTGEAWLDTSLTPNGWKVWTGAAWTNATPVGSDTVQGLLELATNAETQAGSDTARAVTPAGLQSKVSDSTSTTSSTTIASSTAVKSAYDLANAALPKSGGTVTGNLEIGTSGSLTFEGATADAFETTLAVVDPTADRTITFPDTTGTVVTTGDTGTVTSAMIANSTIVDADISASAEIAVSKLADGAARQLLQTDAAGTGVEWTTNVDVPGTLDVTGTTTLDSTLSIPLGSAASPTVFFTGDSNTGIYSPGADQVAISTNSTQRLLVDASGNVGIKNSAPSTVVYSGGASLAVGNGAVTSTIRIADNSEIAYNGNLQINNFAASATIFSTSNIERLRITAGGLVGVGTSVPGYPLTVNGRISYSGAIGEGADTTLSSVSTQVRLADSSTWQSLSLYTAGSSRLFIDSSGRCGIGTSSPTTQLQVIASSSGDICQFGTSAASGQAVKIGVDTSAGTMYFKSNSSNYRYSFQNTAGTENLVILNSGNVGIGTTSPSNTLEISKESNHGITLARPAGGVNPGNFKLEVSSFGAGTLTADNNLSLTTGSSQQLIVSRGATESFRVDASSRLLVGTSTGHGTLQVHDGTFVLSKPATGSERNWRLLPSDAAAGDLAIQQSTTAGGTTYATKLTIDPSGRVGIGTTSPRSLLSFGTADTSGTNGINLYDNGGNYRTGIGATSSYLRLYTPSDGSLQLGRLSTSDGSTFLEAVRIDNSGRLLVGTSTARSNVDASTGLLAPQVQIEGTDAGASSLSIIRNSASSPPRLYLARTKSGSVGGNVAVISDDILGEFLFNGADGTNLIEAASISCGVDGTPGANDMPGRLVFSTTADGASSPTERMRIRSDGRLLTFSSSNSAIVGSTATAAGGAAAVFELNHSATSTTNGTNCFYVLTNGDVRNTNNSYGAISDIKLKENIVDASSQWDDLKALQVRNYNFKPETNQETHTQIGLVAQEVELVSPGLVSESPDRDKDGNDLGTVTKSVNYSVLYMKAVKALQEAMERIETLEASNTGLLARVTALESA
jgi:hypothetical protein